MSFDSNGLRALARVLDYPTPQTIELLPLADELLTGRGTCAAGAGARPCGAMAALIDTLRSTDLIGLQETWIDTFDRGRRTSLNLFEHVHGDSRDRGQAMVDLLAMYRAAGLSPAGDALPDYLPVFLEFASTLTGAEAAANLADIAHVLRAIGVTLLRRGSPYAAVFDALLRLAGEAPLGSAPSVEAEAGNPDAGTKGIPADDTTPEAIDAAWKEAPVEFLDAAPPCSAQVPAAGQPVRLYRRAA